MSEFFIKQDYLNQFNCAMILKKLFFKNKKTHFLFQHNSFLKNAPISKKYLKTRIDNVNNLI